MSASILEVRPEWTSVDDGFFVASLAGDYFGSIDRVGTGYVSIDAVGDPIGLFPTLRAAKAAFTARRTPSADPARERTAFLAATAMTALVVPLAIVGGLLLPL